jgi:hypothetical protein
VAYKRIDPPAILAASKSRVSEGGKDVARRKFVARGTLGGFQFNLELIDFRTGSIKLSRSAINIFLDALE